MGSDNPLIAFVGGGNMASALIGGLVQSGRPGTSIVVYEPDDGQRARLTLRFGVHTRHGADALLSQAALVVWAVKPQSFIEAAEATRQGASHAPQLSVMAGIRTDAIGRATGSARVIRAMPNTPAFIGRGIAGLFATTATTAADRALAESVLAPTGATLWVSREADLDAVTALSGSGPAYVYYFLEAMIQAAGEMGLSAEQGRRLALATFAGATALAEQSDESVATLRERVTSRGGTTYAALMSLDSDAVKAAFVRALHAARRRAQELGDQFGQSPAAATPAAPAAKAQKPESRGAAAPASEAPDPARRRQKSPDRAND